MLIQTCKPEITTNTGQNAAANRDATRDDVITIVCRSLPSNATECSEWSRWCCEMDGTLSSSTFQRQRQLELGDWLIAEFFRGRGHHVHRCFLSFAGLDRAVHQFLDDRSVLACEVNVSLRALEKLRLHVLEDERDLCLEFPHQMKGDQPPGDVRADAERPEVHGTKVVTGSPVGGDAHDAALLIDLENGRLDEVEKEDVLEGPSPNTHGFLQQATVQVVHISVPSVDAHGV